MSRKGEVFSFVSHNQTFNDFEFAKSICANFIDWVVYLLEKFVSNENYEYCNKHLAQIYKISLLGYQSMRLGCSNFNLMNLIASFKGFFYQFLFYAQNQDTINISGISNKILQTKNILIRNKKDRYSESFVEEDFEKHYFQFYPKELDGSCYQFNVSLCFLFLINKIETYPKISNAVDFGNV